MQSRQNKSTHKVGIKLCGHCSPRRDMMAEVAALKRAAEDIEDIDFVFCSQVPEYDLLLVMNACESACAGWPQSGVPVIVVTPETVDYWPVKPEELVKRILERIHEKINGQEE